MSIISDKVTHLEIWQPQITAYLAGLTPPVDPPVAGLPIHRFGVHWIADLYRHSDGNYFNALRPPVIKIVNPFPDRVREAFAAIDTNGHVALRYHPISEQHAEAKADPIGTAKAHAKYWIDQLNGPYKEFDRSKLYVMGLNEPPVHDNAEEQRQALYTETLLRELQPHGIRAYVFNFSVGWPREVSGRIVWDNFLYLEPLINATNSYGCVHEYWYPIVKDGKNDYANRISRCPMKIKFVIGECAYTRQVAGLPQPWGWNGNISADTYAAQLWEYADTVDSTKVFAICPFTTAYGGAEWKNKDTAPAHAAILARKHAYTWPQPWPAYSSPPIDPPEEELKTITWPKMDTITGYYGSLYTNSAGVKYAHEGLDISRVTGTPIYALYDGIVAWSDVEATTYGEYIRTYHPALGICAFYGHLRERLVKTGNSVTRGQLIGYTNNTGNSSGPHLHFEIRAMDGDGRYKPNMSTHGNSRVDALGFLTGWLASGNLVEYR